MKTKVLLTAGLVASMFAAASAWAVPQFTPWQSQAVDIGPNLNQNVNFVFDPFDITMGTLASVHLEVNGDILLNNAVVSTATGPVSIGSPDMVSAVWDIDITTAVAGLGESFLFTTPGFAGNVPPGGPTTIGSIGQVVDAESDIFGTPVTLAAFIGNPVLVNFLSSGTQGGSVPATVFSGNNGTFIGEIRLRYDFEPPAQVPEPASLALVGLALAGIAATRRRKV